ncbi:hypothetical protein GS421_17260 [Rhodococcus hoagii]|nr:hypothetical protein [Prescottella equi]
MNPHLRAGALGDAREAARARSVGVLASNVVIVGRFLARAAQGGPTMYTSPYTLGDLLLQAGYTT